MNKTDARKAATMLKKIGWHDPEIVLYESSWRVYVTDSTTGFSKHFDTMEGVRDNCAETIARAMVSGGFA